MRRLALAGAFLAAAAPAAARNAPRSPGEAAFQRCYACHSLDAAETGLQGPTLAGVVGRRAATVKGFDYSPILRAAGERGLVWTDAALEGFLADPDAMLPGNAMGFVDLRSAAERRAVVAYLKAQAPKRPSRASGR